MNKLSKYQFAFVPVVAIIFAVTTGIVYLPGKISSTYSNYQKIEKTNNETSEITRKLNIINSMDKETLQKQFELSLKAIPAEKKIDEIFRVVEQIAGTYNYSIRKLALAPGEFSSSSAQLKKEKVESLPIQLTAIGASDKLVDFLKEFENSLPINTILNIEYSRASGVVNGSLKLQLYTYYNPILTSEISSAKLNTVNLVITSSEKELLSKLEQYRRFDSVVASEEDQVPVDPNRNPFMD